MGLATEDVAENLAILDLVGHPAVLIDQVPGAGLGTTLQYDWLRERMDGQQVLIIDGVADAYGGNENARGEVKRFINALLSLIPTDGALLLQHHVNKVSAASSGTSEGYSGSTGWHNSVRARWYLHPETQHTDEGVTATGELLLELQKSNLGRADQSMRFRWDDDAHLFVGKFDQKSEFDRRLQETEERDGIVAALRDVLSGGDYCPAATTGNRTANHVLRAADEFPKTLQANSTANRRRFWRHMEALRRMGAVK